MDRIERRTGKWHLLLPILSIVLSGMLCFSSRVHAVEFNVKGVWINMLEYGAGGNFISKGREGRSQQGFGKWGEDEFEAKSRVRLWFNAKSSEDVSGTVYFEIGSIPWGRANRGGALGADGIITKIKHAYIDWLIPSIDVHVRMGIQRIFLPDFATEASQVFDADVAGTVLSATFSDNVALTGFWARPFNDNWDGGSDPVRSHYLDNADLFGLTLPFTFEGFRLTPWVMFGIFGNNAFRNGDGTYYSRSSGASYGLGLAPTAYAESAKENTNDYATAFWAGLSGEVTAADPFRMAFSFNYGSVDTGEDALNRCGWFASLLAEYKFDWGVPGIYGWYSSGDDDDPTNGSERLPNIEGNNESTSGYTTIATMGTWTLGRDGMIGTTLAGTWGLGLRLRDISFIDKLTHTLHLNWYQGTNSADMARYVKGAPSRYNIVRPERQDFTSSDFFGLYLTDQDTAYEVGLSSQYQIYDNLKLLVEANYIALALDNSSSVWGGYTDAGGVFKHANSVKDLWNVNLSVIYKF